MRKINDAGLSLLKEFEGCKLTSYRDQGGVLTIGYGHTGTDVEEGQTITQEQADSLLQENVQSTSNRVEALTQDADLNDNQFSALVCLTYNIGIGNFQKSKLLRLIRLDQLDLSADEFVRWSTIHGVPNKGLLRRRTAEKSLFLA